jgi:hypothetical protein
MGRSPTKSMSRLSPTEVIERVESGGREGRTYIELLDVPGKTPVLCEALKQASSPQVRQVLCSMFSSMADPEALECLLAALDDQVPEVAAAAADAIGNCAFGQTVDGGLRTRLGEKLLTLLRGSSHIHIRASSLYALGLMRFQPGLTQIAAALEDDAPMVRWCAAEALSYLGGAEARSALTSRQTREAHERVLRYIQLALQSFEEKRD